jgi:putative transposase
LLDKVKTSYATIKKIFADMAYQRKSVKQEVSDLGKKLKIVTRPPTRFWVPRDVIDVVSYLEERGIEVPQGFKVLPKRWVLERTFAWIDKFKGFSKDYEFKCSTSENLIMIAMARNFLHNISALQ